MAVKNNRRTKLTKMLLKNSLIELMNDKAVNHITIKELCEKADLNRSTFYLHYTDQYQLLSEIENDLLEDTIQYLRNVTTDCGTTLYITAFLKYVKNNSSIFRILLCRQENTDFQTAFIEKIMGHLKETLPAVYSAEIEKYIYGFVIHGCLQVIRDWILSGYDLPEQTIADIIYQLCHKSYSEFSAEQHPDCL